MSEHALLRGLKVSGKPLSFSVSLVQQQISGEEKTEKDDDKKLSLRILLAKMKSYCRI